MDIGYLVACFLKIAFFNPCIHGSDILRQIFLRAKDQYDLKTFVLVSSHKSEVASRFSMDLQHNSSVPIIHYTHLWSATFNHNEMEATPILLNNFGEWILYIIFLDDLDTRQAVLRNAFRLLERRPYSKVIFEIGNGTTQILDALFRQCFDYGLLRVVIILRTFPPTLFAYRPFDGFKIIQISENSELFIDKCLNLNKHKIKTIRSGNPPSLVWYKMESGLVIPKGFTGHLVTTFMEKRNASLEYVELTSKEAPLDELRLRIVRKQIDFTLTLFPLLKLEFGDYAYPMSQEKFNIIVPAPQTIPSYQNFTLPFDTDTWLALIIGLFYSTCIVYVVNTVNTNRKDISGAFLTAFCMLINIPGIGVFYRNKLRVMVFYLPLFIFGFIVSNMYLAFLTTFLTSPAYERAITTWDDIKRADLKIVAEQNELIYVLMLAPDLSKYSNLFKAAYFSEFVNIRETLNNSNAVMMLSGIWSTIDDIQRHRNSIKLQDSGIPIIPMQMSIIFKCESPFIEDFTDHIMKAFQSGLIYYWRKNALLELQQGHLLHTTKISVMSGPLPLDLSTLKIAFFILIAGLNASLVIFCIESLVNVRSNNYIMDIFNQNKKL